MYTALSFYNVTRLFHSCHVNLVFDLGTTRFFIYIPIYFYEEIIFKIFFLISQMLLFFIFWICNRIVPKIIQIWHMGIVYCIRPYHSINNIPVLGFQKPSISR